MTTGSLTEYRLARLTRPEILERARAHAMCVVPVASMEQHGAHLPVGTDSALVDEICLRAAQSSAADVLVAPVIWTGFSPHHLRFGATVSVSAETLLSLLRESVASIRTWLPLIVLVNGHGGNRGVVQTFALEADVPFVNYWDLAEGSARELFAEDHGSIGHAGQAETSMMLALNRDSGRLPEKSFTECSPEDRLFLPDLGTSGVVGNPHAASSAAGVSFLDAVIVGLARWLETVAISHGATDESGTAEPPRQ